MPMLDHTFSSVGCQVNPKVMAGKQEKKPHGYHFLRHHRVVTLIHTTYVILPHRYVSHRLVNRNNADLGKGVPRQHVFP
jgi:hypothetical protein